MSAARAAFLQAICENPDDDTLRLVFADWLDEHDEPGRAEFIRLQIGLSAGTIPEDRRAEAEVRVAELLARNQPAWEGELPHRPGMKWVSAPALFTRGFADAVMFRHGKAWRSHAAEVFAAAPVSRLRCGGVFTARTGRPIFASPLLARITDFSAPPIDRVGAEALADNPHLAGHLRVLGINSAREEAAGVAAALARAGGLRNLESLTFGWTESDGIAALIGSPHLSRLKSLFLHSNPVGDDGAEAIASSPYLTCLESLFLNYSGVGDRGAIALARSEHLTSVQTLYLGGNCPITDTGALAIATSPGLPRLTDLHLWGSRVGEAGARALVDFAERRGLRVLNLLGCPIPDDLARAIASRYGPR